MSALVTSRRPRVHPRVPAILDATVEAGRRAAVLPVEDLSMAGLSVVGLRAEPGDRVQVTLRLPDRLLRLEAVVRRSHGTSIGLEFLDLDWDDLLALARYVHPRLD